MFRRTLYLLILISLLIPLTTHAQSDPVTDDDVNAVARDLFCPTCENTPLDVCPTKTCDDWRGEIRTRLNQGQSKEEITAYFAATYGDHVLAEPPREGFDLIVWVLPWITVILAGFGFIYYLRQIRTTPPASPNTTPTTTTPSIKTTNPELQSYLQTIEKELEERNTK